MGKREHMNRRIFLVITLGSLLGGCDIYKRSGGQRDSYGCLGSGGYSWCPATERCERSCDDSDQSDASKSQKFDGNASVWESA